MRTVDAALSPVVTHALRFAALQAGLLVLDSLCRRWYTLLTGVPLSGGAGAGLSLLLVLYYVAGAATHYGAQAGLLLHGGGSLSKALGLGVYIVTTALYYAVSGPAGHHCSLYEVLLTMGRLTSLAAVRLLCSSLALGAAAAILPLGASRLALWGWRPTGAPGGLGFGRQTVLLLLNAVIVTASTLWGHALSTPVKSPPPPPVGACAPCRNPGPSRNPPSSRPRAGGVSWWCLPPAWRRPLPHATTAGACARRLCARQHKPCPP